MRRQKREPRRPQGRVVGHHEHVREEAVNGGHAGRDTWLSAVRKSAPARRPSAILRPAALELAQQGQFGRLVQHRAQRRQVSRRFGAFTSLVMFFTRLKSTSPAAANSGDLRAKSRSASTCADAVPGRAARADPEVDRADVSSVGSRGSRADVPKPLDEKLEQLPRRLRRRRQVTARRIALERRVEQRAEVDRACRHARSCAWKSTRILHDACAPARSPTGSREPVGFSPAREQADDGVELVGEGHRRPGDRRALPSLRGARAAHRPRRRPAGSGSRSPSTPLPAAPPRARRCRPSCPAVR